MTDYDMQRNARATQRFSYVRPRGNYEFAKECVASILGFCFVMPQSKPSFPQSSFIKQVVNNKKKSIANKKFKN